MVEYIVMFSQERAMWIFYACAFLFYIPLGNAKWPVIPRNNKRISIIYTFFRYGLSSWPAKNSSEHFAFFWEVVALYALFTFVMCMHIQNISYELVGMLIRFFPEYNFFGLTTVILCALFSILLLKSTLNLIHIKIGALHISRIYIVLYTLFCTFIPIVIYFLCSMQNGINFNFDNYKQRWPQSHMYGSLLISTSWYLYFKFSKKINNAFYELENNNTDTIFHK